jgi:hypothetical protein
MTTRQLTSTIIFSILSFNFYSQKAWVRDNDALFKTWERTAHFLKTKDTTGLRAICADTIEYINVDYKTGTSSYTYLPLSSFFRQTLDSIVHDKRLAKVIEKNNPRLETCQVYFKDGSEHTAYMVVFSYKNPKRNSEIYKYRAIYFYYIDLKLFNINRQRPLN